MNDDGVLVGILAFIGVNVIDGWASVILGVLSSIYMILKIITWFENRKKEKKSE